MEFAEYQKKSRETAMYPGAGNNFVYPALGLAGEGGEVVNKIKKIARDDADQVTEEKKQEIKNELGDLIWYVAQLATELGLELEEVASENIEKLQDRKERGALHGSGDNR